MICLKNSRHNKFCFFLPSAWPTPVPAGDSSWTDGTIDAKSIGIDDGMYAFWFDSEDRLQAAT